MDGRVAPPIALLGLNPLAELRGVSSIATTFTSKIKFLVFVGFDIIV